MALSDKPSSVDVAAQLLPQLVSDMEHMRL